MSKRSRLFCFVWYYFNDIYVFFLIRVCLQRSLHYCIRTFEILKEMNIDVQWHGREKGEAAHYCSTCEVRKHSYVTKDWFILYTNSSRHHCNLKDLVYKIKILTLEHMKILEQAEQVRWLKTRTYQFWENATVDSLQKIYYPMKIWYWIKTICLSCSWIQWEY